METYHKLKKIIEFKGIFSPLADKDFFSRVTVNTDVGTICWENGAAIAPCTLYNMLDSKSA